MSDAYYTAKQIRAAEVLNLSEIVKALLMLMAPVGIWLGLLWLFGIDVSTLAEMLK